MEAHGEVTLVRRSAALTMLLALAMDDEVGGVPRPLKRGEFELVFITNEAQRGWMDCVAAARNAMVDAWDQLTRAPEAVSGRLYALRGELRYGTYQGRTFERFQYKFSDGGRLWYFVEHAGKGSGNAGRVLLERCMPGHPEETE